MTMTDYCMICGTPLTKPGDRHICDACGAAVRKNSAIGAQLLRALYLTANADMQKTRNEKLCDVCVHNPSDDGVAALACIAAEGDCEACKSDGCVCRRCDDYMYFRWRGLGIRSME